MAEVVVSTKGSRIMIHDDGFLYRDPTQWLISLEQNRLSRSYVRDCGSRLADWITFIESKRLGLYEPVTQDFRDYRDSQVNVGLAPETINQKIIAVIEFYWWAQAKGLCHQSLLGWNDFMKPGVPFQIEIEAPQTSRRKQGGRYRIPFLLKAPSKKRKSMLTAVEVRDLYASIEERAVASKNKIKDAIIARNHLMLDWMIYAGLRRNEVVSLSLSSIPEVSDKREFSLVQVTISDGTKNSKARVVDVPSSLLRDTWDYVDIERCDIVESHLDGSDPGYLFVSQKKPGKLAGDSVYKMITRAGLGIHPHDLRSYGLFCYACDLYRIERLMVKSGDRARVDVNLIEYQLRKQAGHESLDTTLRYYVNLAEVATASANAFEELEDFRGRIVGMIERQQEVSKETRRAHRFFS